MSVTPTERAPRDWVAHGMVAVGFASVMLIAVGYAQADYRVGPTITGLLPWLAIVSLIVFVRLTTPSSRLSPERKARRGRRRVGFLIGALSAISVLFAIVAVRYLHSWPQIVVFLNFVIFGIGVLLALHVRFTIGKW